MRRIRWIAKRGIPGAIARLIAATVVHDLAVDSCSAWWRVPMQLASEFLIEGPPYGRPFYEFTHGANEAAELRGYVVRDPWLLKDLVEVPRVWTDVQSGRAVIVDSASVVVLMRTSWVSQEELEALLERKGVPLGASPGTEPFIAVQVGGGVGGLARQAVLLRSGRVTEWVRERGCDQRPTARQREIPQEVSGRLFRLASSVIRPGARCYWNCLMLDGATFSLTLYDGAQLGRGHWVNKRQPPDAALEIASALLPALPEPRTRVPCPPGDAP